VPRCMRDVLRTARLIYRFEDYSLDTERRELRRGGVLRPLEPQVFDLLGYLIRNRERVVSREEAFKAIWHGRIVSDATLYTRIHAARQAIGDSGSEQRLISTLPSKGLRFVGGVREENEVGGIPARSPGKDSSLELMLADQPAIAVLPFANLSGDVTQESVADAFTEHLITALARVDWLSVVSRTSSFAYKGKAVEVRELARTLRVRYVLEGSVRPHIGCLRIAVQLVDGLTGHHIWVERYERAMAGIAAVEDEIISSVVTAIGPRLYRAEHQRAERKSAENLSRWECIVRALALVNSRDKSLVAAAQDLTQKAIMRDPKSAQAHSLLSFIITLGVHQGWQKRGCQIPLALQIARNALSLNSDDPWAHLALGYATIWVHPEDAIAELQKALALNPNLATAHYLIALASAWAGQGEHALGHADLAERLSPTDLLARGNAGTHNNVRATACFALGRYREGSEFARKAIIDNPSMPTAHRALLMNCALAGNWEESAAARQKLVRLAPDMSQRWIRETAVWTRREDQDKYVEAFRAAGVR
jgi:TolB-like protein